MRYPRDDERQPLLASPDNEPRHADAITADEQRDYEQRNHNDTNIEELSNYRLALILGSIWVGVFFVALDSTIVATLLTPISSSFSSLSDLSWLASAFFIANAASQPIAGRFSDIFGRRSGLLVCNITFGTGTLLCGVAGSEWMILLGRVVAGLGGGGIYALSTIVGSDLVPLRKRGFVQGLSNISFSVGTGLGGLFGGWMNDTWGWKWAFLIQVPFIALAAILVQTFVEVPVKKSQRSALRRIDYLGTVTLVGTVVLLLLGLNAGGNSLPWSHPLVIASLCSSAALLATFIYIEERVASEPVIPLKLMMKRTVAASCLTFFFTHAATFAILFYIPVFLQASGLSTTQAGLRLIPQSVCTAIGSLSVGYVIRSTGNYTYINICIQVILILGYILLSTLKFDVPTYAPFMYLALTGLGFGGVLVVCLVSLISSVESEFQAVLTSASFAFRSTGSILGISITSTVFQHVLRNTLRDRLGHTIEADRIISLIREQFDEIWRTPAAIRQDILDSYAAALRAVFILTLAMTLAGALCSFFIRQNKLFTNLARK